MSTYADTVHHDTPRLVVMFKQDGLQEQYQWGIVGIMPILSLIGYIGRVQQALIYGGSPDCPESALVIAYDTEIQTFDYFVHPDIPVNSLIGMLDVVKFAIIASRAGQQAAAQKVQIYGPDGSPLRM